MDDGDSTDSQPEWGVDSHDEKEYCSPDEDGWSDEEDERKARLYRRNLHLSHVRIFTFSIKNSVFNNNNNKTS